jgi:hypothetical protein
MVEKHVPEVRSQQLMPPPMTEGQAFWQSALLVQLDGQPLPPPLEPPLEDPPPDPPEDVPPPPSSPETVPSWLP